MYALAIIWRSIGKDVRSGQPGATTSVPQAAGLNNKTMPMAKTHKALPNQHVTFWRRLFLAKVHIHWIAVLKPNVKSDSGAIGRADADLFEPDLAVGQK